MLFCNALFRPSPKRRPVAGSSPVTLYPAEGKPAPVTLTWNLVLAVWFGQTTDEYTSTALEDVPRAGRKVTVSDEAGVSEST
jgi:hypothetical protein